MHKLQVKFKENTNDLKIVMAVLLSEPLLCARHGDGRS